MQASAWIISSSKVSNLSLCVFIGQVIKTRSLILSPLQQLIWSLLPFIIKPDSPETSALSTPKSIVKGDSIEVTHMHIAHVCTIVCIHIHRMSVTRSHDKTWACRSSWSRKSGRACIHHTSKHWLLDWHQFVSWLEFFIFAQSRPCQKRNRHNYAQLGIRHSSHLKHWNALQSYLTREEDEIKFLGILVFINNHRHTLWTHFGYIPTSATHFLKISHRAQQSSRSLDQLWHGVRSRQWLTSNWTTKHLSDLSFQTSFWARVLELGIPDGLLVHFSFALCTYSTLTSEEGSVDSLTFASMLCTRLLTEAMGLVGRREGLLFEYYSAWRL